jgi:hypothetical protein
MPISLAFHGHQKNLKLTPKLFLPWKILSKDWHINLSYPQNPNYIWFSMSLLRKRIGNQEEISPPLPESPATSAPRSIPRAILGTRKKGGEKEALVYWQNLSPAEPAWESLAELKTRFFLNLWELRLQACRAASFFEEIIVNKI